MAKRRTCECKSIGCYNLTDSKTGYCKEHEGKYLARQNEVKKRWKEKTGYKQPHNNTKTEKFYSSGQWQFLRHSKLADEDFLCEECRRHGVTNNATQIHHKVPILKDWSKRFDYDNLEALCYKCHKFLRDKNEGKYTWEQVHSDDFVY